MKRPLKIKNLWNDSFSEVIDGFVDNVTEYFPGWTLDEIKFSFESDVEWDHGERWAAPVIYKLREKITPEYSEEHELLNSTQNASLGKRINLHYRDKWKHLAELWQTEYDPLHNYLDEYTGQKDTESEEIKLDVSQLSGSNVLSVLHGQTDTRTLNVTKLRTDALTETRNLTDTDNNRQKEISYGKTDTKTDSEIRVHEDDINENVQTANWIAGYNSTGGATDSGGVFSDRSHEHTYDTDDKQKDYVQEGNVKNVLSGKDTEKWSGNTTHTGTVGNTGTQTTADTGTDTLARSGTDTQTQAFGKKDTRDGNKNGTEAVTFEMVHKGNIGNIYTQDMFRKELELWRETFYHMMLADILDFISLNVY